MWSYLSAMLPERVRALAMRWLETLEQLPYDGGPSVARWVYVRVSEVVSWCLVAMVAALVYRYWRFGTADVTYAGVVTFTLTAVIGFAQWVYRLKLTTSAMTPGSGGGMESGPLGDSVANGDKP